MTGNTVLQDVGATPLEIFDYKKADSAHQELYLIKDGDFWKIRARDNGTILTPTGGDNDVEFTSSRISYEQIGDFGFIGCDSATTILYRWDGTKLDTVINTDPNIIGLSSDGRRLAAIWRDKAEFSTDGVITSLNWRSGTNINRFGDYNISVRPTAIVKAGTGVIIFGDVGAEAHFVRPNNASDNVSSQTRIENFSYRGSGVKKQDSAVSGETYVYFYNNEGVSRMNPYDGTVESLTEQKGAIERYWHELVDITSSKLKYSRKESAVVLSVAEIGGSNDKLLCYYEETDSFHFKSRVYSQGLGDVDGQLLSGEGTNLVKIFDDQTYTDKDDQKMKARVIVEWNAVGDPFKVKRFLSAHYMAKLSPLATFMANVYVNGYLEPVATNTFKTTDVVSNSGVVEMIGTYVLAKGGAELNDNSLQIDRVRQLNKLTIYCTEIIEESVDAFELVSIAAQTSSYGTENITLTQADLLFPFSA